MPERQPPSAEYLRAGLSELFGAPVTLLERQPNPYASTFSSERVSCRLRCGEVLELFCKHSGGFIPSDGHHGGVAYEAVVYRRVLGSAPGLSPTFHGTFGQQTTGEETLVLQAVDGALRLSRAPAPESMPRSASWLGEFHRHFETESRYAGLSFLHAYDADYYRHWAARTEALAAPLARRYPWLAPLCRSFAQTFARSLLESATVIHGEYYPHNVLVREGTVLPVDWESTAIAAGEIDLATLTENWPPEVVDACSRAYRQARWPEGAPADFQTRLKAARLYLHLRWLGDRAAWTHSPGYRWRFDRLGETAQRLGIG